MSKHSNSDIDISAHPDTGELNRQLEMSALVRFQGLMNEPLPPVSDCLIRILDIDFFYASDLTEALIAEYQRGSDRLLLACFDDSEARQKAVHLVGVICSKMFEKQETLVKGNGIYAIETDDLSVANQSYDQVRFACLCVALNCQAKVWNTRQDFFAAYYVLAAWPLLAGGRQ